ncbi:unnamed protein product [Linum trigynum]|uniref:NmrA-like domain-containing protein n=1 Tax=Linum trigynum TaxID=586398 RepID=A0AAV2EV68_9ROSI
MLAESKNQGWDLGRFVKTFYFFNSPPSRAKFIQCLINRISSPSPSEENKTMKTSGVVLVVGATGGVGKRVVDILKKKGVPVRALVIKFFEPEMCTTMTCLFFGLIDLRVL